MNIDKRDHKRLKTRDLTVKYKLDGKTAVNKAEVINISSGGICFLRSAYLEVGDIIHLKFPFKSKKILLNAKVIRMDGREAGIKFLDTDEQIENFIKVFNLEYPQLKREDFRKKEDYYKRGLNPNEEEEEETGDEWLEIDKIE